MFEYNIPEAKQDAIRDYRPKAVTINSNVRTNYDWSEEGLNRAINKMLIDPRYRGRFKNSVLLGKAEAFIKSGKKYNIDPRLIIAIAMHESDRGTSNRAFVKNNVGGSKFKFKSIEESIDSIAKTIDTNYKKGFKTPHQNAMPYTCSPAAAPQWEKGVGSYINQLNRYYKP